MGGIIGGVCSVCRMKSARGFSRGTNNTSALGVLGVSSPSLKNETCSRNQIMKSAKLRFLQVYLRIQNGRLSSSGILEYTGQAL